MIREIQLNLCSLLFPFLLSLSRSESAITYISSALSIAGRLGLHQLGPEMPNLSVRETEKRYGKRWVEVKRREEGRRVMWNLVRNLEQNGSSV